MRPSSCQCCTPSVVRIRSDGKVLAGQSFPSIRKRTKASGASLRRPGLVGHRGDRLEDVAAAEVGMDPAPALGVAVPVDVGDVAAPAVDAVRMSATVSEPVKSAVGARTTWAPGSNSRSQARRGNVHSGRRCPSRTGPRLSGSGPSGELSSAARTPAASNHRRRSPAGRARGRIARCAGDRRQGTRWPSRARRQRRAAGPPSRSAPTSPARVRGSERVAYQTSRRPVLPRQRGDRVPSLRYRRPWCAPLSAGHLVHYIG